MNPAASETGPARPASWISEDLLAILIGSVILLAGWMLVRVVSPPTAFGPGQAAVPAAEVAPVAEHLLSGWFRKPGKWTSHPGEAFEIKGQSAVPGVLGAGMACLVLVGGALRISGQPIIPFARGFVGLYLLALAAFLMAGQRLVEASGLEYALWALLGGLLISNTIGTPEWLRPALRTELYIKSGLILLGAEVLMGKLVALGLPGIFVAWVVTPIVLITTYWFGQRILKIGSPSLNMVISADMSVCGVSAAIATAAACRAKKEELSTAIGLSLCFTVIMMFVMPLAIRAMGIDNIVGGAWMGGTIDSTGAVAAAGAMLGEDAKYVATTVKMIQNILIGVIAFGVSVYWVAFVEPAVDGPRPGIAEIWRRFPKFILGFAAASVVFSLVHDWSPEGPVVVKSMIDVVSKTIQVWLFCLAFTSIGLDTNFTVLWRQMAGGKPLILYVCGQTLNLILTLAMAWLMFRVVFPDAAVVLQK